MIKSDCTGALRFVAIAVIACSYVLCNQSLARGEVFYSEYTYVMGERDSILDAKKISFIEAKRLLVEQAGTYVKSNSMVSDGVLTEDKIETYALAIMKVEVDTQNVVSKEDSLAVYTKVKGLVDCSNMSEDIAAINNNNDLQAELDQQKSSLNDTHEQIGLLNKKIRELEINNASEDGIRRTVKKREAALNTNIMQGAKVFCTMACRTARFRESQFVQTFFENAGMADMLVLLMGQEECSLFCVELNRSMFGCLLDE